MKSPTTSAHNFESRRPPPPPQRRIQSLITYKLNYELQKFKPRRYPLGRTSITTSTEKILCRCCKVNPTKFFKQPVTTSANPKLDPSYIPKSIPSSIPKSHVLFLNPIDKSNKTRMSQEEFQKIQGKIKSILKVRECQICWF